MIMRRKHCQSSLEYLLPVSGEAGMQQNQANYSKGFVVVRGLVMC